MVQFGRRFGFSMFMELLKVFYGRHAIICFKPKKIYLKRRRYQDPLYPICGMDVENICHILWCCPSACDVWGECSRKIKKCSIGGDDFFQVVAELLDKVGGKRIQFIGHYG
jgi:hypothetical protein